MPSTYYRIYDFTDQHILANAIPEQHQAEQILDFLRKEYPRNEILIEPYQVYDRDAHRLGRDPDLH